MAYNTPESVADYLSRFQMQVTERTKGTFSPMHVKYSLALKMGSHLSRPLSSRIQMFTVSRLSRRSSVPLHPTQCSPAITGWTSSRMSSALT